MTMTRTVARSAGALALATVATVLVAAPAQASAYRYWTYWQAPAGAATWSFATQGPATSLPADGSVEGWSFGVTTTSGSRDDAPATAPDFASICGNMAAEAGRKRIALVIDSGPAAVAPDGELPPAPVATCVVTDEQASGYDVLRSIAEVRTEDGLICGVAGYPARECAPVLDDAEADALLAAAAAAPTAGAPSATASDGSGADAAGGMSTTPDAGTTGTPLATLAVAALLLGGGAVAVASRRRRSTATDSS